MKEQKVPQLQGGEALTDTVVCGDSAEVLTQIPDNTIDLLCTDPPYG